MEQAAALRDGTRLGTDFTQGDISRHLVRFMLPLLLAGILNSSYNAVDMIVIGRFAGSVGTVAVSMGGKLLMTLTLVSTAMSIAGQVLIGQLYGNRRHEDVQATIGTLFSLLGLASIALGILSILLSRAIVVWMNTPAESLGPAQVYLRITSAGLPLLFGYNASCTVLRAMGDSKRPLIFIAIAATVNLVLDIVFIVAFDMGAAGTAYATVIGQGIAFSFAVGYLYRHRDRFGFDFRRARFRIERDKARALLRMGIPLAATSFFISGTQLVMMGYVNAFGVAEAAAYGIGDKIMSLESVVAQATNQAGSTIVAQNMGAGKPERVRQLVRAALAISLSFAALAAMAALLFPRSIFGIFTTDEAVMRYAVAYMAITAATFFVAAMMSAFDTVTTGTGNARLKLIGGMLDGVVLRVMLGLFFGFTLGMRVVGFYLGHCVARFAPLTCHLAYYASGRWQDRRVA